MARKAFQEVTIPSELARLDSEAMLPPADIIGAFIRANPSFPPESIALSCGNNRLTAIEICMSKTLQPIACESIRSCRAQQVKITPP
ncbi:ribonuclease [Granulicella sibirica]|uniref:Ribonuclease n=2 Tax=Granulicella sibirica TaxID=2479048 RepID=A0A4Q0SZC5_9BACT|nr:ribonuclease [Granulicella sibirica]